MHVGPSVRSRKTQREYMHHKAKAGDVCEFCDFTLQSPQIIGDNKYFWVVRNIFPYDIWDDMNVTDHLMIVPKRHIVGLHEYTQHEQEFFFNLASEYEAIGYSIYSRAPADPQKSVVHQHTHLILLGTKRMKFKIHIRKPHVLIYK